MTHFITRYFTQPRHMLINAMATLAIATTALTPAFAEGKHKMADMSEQERLEHMEDRLDKRMARLTKELTLSDDQARRVRDILSNAQTERLDIRARHAEDRKAAKPEMEALKLRSHDELKRVLTTAQFDTFEALEAARHDKKMKHRKGGHAERGAKHLARLTTELNLSADQSAKIKAIHADRKLASQALIEKAGSREAAKPELKALRQASHQEVRALLTPAQQEKFEAMKKSARDHRKDKGQK